MLPRARWPLDDDTGEALPATNLTTMEAKMPARWHHETFGGYAVVLYEEDVDDPHGYTIFGRVKVKGDRWVPVAWDNCGTMFGASRGKPHDLDLVRLGSKKEPAESVFEEGPGAA